MLPSSQQSVIVTITITITIIKSLLYAIASAEHEPHITQ